MKPISKWNKQTIVNHYQLGVSLSKLARRYKISRDQVKAILEEKGVRVGGRKYISEVVVNRWAGMYEDEGKSCEAIGAEFGVSENTVAKYLKKAGVKIRKRTGKYDHPKYARDARRMWRKGLSVTEIAAVMELHRNTVKRLLQGEGPKA